MPYYIKSKGLTSNPNSRILGTLPTKDMTQTTSSATYNGYTFPANCYYFSDWGNDCFDNFGYFTLERVSDGSKVAIPLANANTSDGVITATSFSAFGNTYSLKYGYPVQGIFKVELELTSGTEIDVKLVIGGNFGSDGSEGYTDYSQTFVGSVSGTTYYLKYFRHYDTTGSDPSVFFYFIPQDDTYLGSSYTFTRSYSSDNAYFYRTFKHGITLYMSRSNDTYQWVLDDLQEISTTNNYVSSVNDVVTINDAINNFINLLKSEALSLSDILTPKFLYYGFGVDKFGINKWGNNSINLTKSDNITLSDLLTKLTNKKGVNDTLTLSDSVISNLQKTLNESLTVSESITPQLFVLLTDVLTVSDSLIKIANMLKSDTTTITDDINSFTRKFINDILTLDYLVGLGVSVPSDILYKDIQPKVSETINLLDTLTQTIGKYQNDIVTLVDSITKNSNLTLNETLTLIDSIIKSIVLNNFTESIVLVDTLINNFSKFNGDVIALSESITSLLNKYGLNDSGNITDNLVNFINKVVSDTTTNLDSVVSNIQPKTNEGLNIFEGLGFNVNKVLSDVVSLTDSISKNLYAVRPIPPNFSFGSFDNTQFGGEVLGITDSISEIKRGFGVVVSDIATLVDSIIKNIQSNLNDGITTNEQFSKTVTLSDIQETTTLNDSLLREIRILKQESITLLEAISSNLSKILNESLVLSDDVSLQPILYFVETVSLVDIIQKYINSLNTDSVTILESLIKSISPQNFAENVVINDGLLKSFLTSFNETLLLIDDLTKAISCIKIEAVTLADGLSNKYINTSIDDVLTVLEDITKLILQENQNEAINILDNFLKNIVNSISNENVIQSDGITFNIQPKQADTIGFAENFVINFSKKINDVVTLSDLLNLKVGLLKNEAVNLNDNISSSFVKVLSDIAIINDSLLQNYLTNIPKRTFGFGLFNYTSFGGNDSDTEIFEVSDDISIIQYYSKLLNDIINLSETLNKVIGESGNNENQNVLDTLGINIGKNVVDDIILSEGIEKFNIGKILNEVVSTTDTIVKYITSILNAEIATINEGVSKLILPALYNDFLTLIDSINVLLSKVASSAVSLSDSIRLDIQASRQEVINILEALGFDITKPLPTDLVGVLEESWIKAITQKQSYIMVGDELVEIVKKVVIMNQVFINGVQVPVVGLTIKDTTTERVSTCEFTIPDPSPEVIALCKQRAEVRVYLVDEYGNAHYFGGRIKNNPISTDSPMTSLLKVVAFDYTDYSNDVRVIETYTDKDGTLTDILKKMWQKYSPINIDLSQVVNTDKTVSYISFRYDTLFDATEKIAQLLGYHWYVEWNGSGSNSLKFFPGNNTVKNVTLSRENLNIVAGTINFGQSDKLFNRIYLFGGKTYSSDYTHTITANGSDTIYSIPHKPYPPLGKDMVVIKVNGVEKVVDFDYPYWIDGVDVMLNVDGKYIRFNQNTKPANGSIIEVVYRYEYPVALVLDDAESIRRFGLSETVITDEKITDYTNGIDYLKQLLKESAYPVNYGTLETTESSLKAGDIIRVYLPHLLIDDLFEIIEVEKSIDRNVIRTKLTLNRTENPDEVIAKRLKDFAKRLKELELKDVKENTIIQKINSAKEVFKMKDTLSILGNIGYNISGDNVIPLDGYRITHTTGTTKNYYEKTFDVVTNVDSIKSDVGKKDGNVEGLTAKETVFIGLTDDTTNVFGIATFGNKKFVKGVWIA